MDEEDLLSWDTEPIDNYLDEHFLYRGVNKVLWKNWPDLKNIYPNFFITSQAKEGLSMDWSKYASPSFTLKHLPIPDLKTNGIVEMNVGELKDTISKSELPISIQHDPVRTLKENQKPNRAHTLITGINKTNKAKVKRRLSRISRWATNMTPLIN